ncbi:MAG: DMT family transporter, partial [Pseudomonadota bacterium]
SKVLVRTESSSAIVTYELLVLFCVSVVWMPQTWITPAALDWPIIALIGIMGSLCVYYRTRACEYSPLSVLAPFEYTGMIWAILFGFVIWSELPDMWGWFGAALIAASGVYVTRQQKD